MSTNYNHNGRILYKTVNPSYNSNSAVESLPAVFPTAKKSQIIVQNEGGKTLNGVSWPHSTDAGGNWTGSSQGDPTTTDSVNGNFLSLSVYTTETHSANVFWGSTNKNYISERGIRGLSFRSWHDDTNGTPRIRGVALVYMNDSGNKIYCPLTFATNSYTYSHHGNIDVNTNSKQNRYWGVIAKGTATSDAFHMKAYKWAGVLFHYRTNKKTGSARAQPVYISHLRPICDDSRNTSPSYKNQYRMWSCDFK